MRSERDIAYFNSVCFDEGLEKGRKQEKIDLAKKMKESGISLTQIAEITGLSEDDISML